MSNTGAAEPRAPKNVARLLITIDLPALCSDPAAVLMQDHAVTFNPARSLCSRVGKPAENTHIDPGSFFILEIVLIASNRVPQPHSPASGSSEMFPLAAGAACPGET